MRRTVELTEQEEKELQELCDAECTRNASQVIRKGLKLFYKSVFLPQNNEKSIIATNVPIVSATVATPIVSATVASAPAPAPAADQPERYFLCPSAQASTGLYGLYADIEMLEEKLAAAGWATEWEEGLVFGTNPKYEGGRRLQLTIPEPTEDFS